jgi:hypothetical protein
LHTQDGKKQGTKLSGRWSHGGTVG